MALLAGFVPRILSSSRNQVNTGTRHIAQWLSVFLLSTEQCCSTRHQGACRGLPTTLSKWNRAMSKPPFQHSPSCISERSCRATLLQLSILVFRRILPGISKFYVTTCFLTDRPPHSRCRPHVRLFRWGPAGVQRYLPRSSFPSPAGNIPSTS